MSDTPLVVTLEQPINVPGGSDYPAGSTTFRAREHTVPTDEDDMFTFFGVNVGPDKTILDIDPDNVRGIAYVGEVIDIEDEDNDDE